MMISPNRFKGKIIVMTGATAGIGFDAARIFGLEGGTVIISSRKQKKVDAALKKLKSLNINCYGMVCHVAKKKHRHRFLKFIDDKFGTIDVLSWNAGIGFYAGCYHD